jgi:CRISPR-associated protein Cas2
MRYVISYDVSDDRRRYRAVEALKDYAHRVQYSVFECDLEAEELETLLKRVEKALDLGEDSCRVYRVCGECARQVRILGKGEPYQEPKTVVI